ncbi:MAG: NUDIX hydrolase, partial [Symbiobacteriaceae bacterium]|nr:NUDIX hydrolase [Symbiobacteriaceae bacterium]
MRNLEQIRLSGKTLISTSIFRIEEDQARLPDGSVVNRAVLRKGAAVIIVPITSQGTVLLVAQWRYPVAQALVELPAGGIEGEETPEEAAIRELQEEAGYLP